MSWKEMKQLTSFNLENPGIYLASCGHQSPIRIESGIPSAIADQGEQVSIFFWTNRFKPPFFHGNPSYLMLLFPISPNTALLSSHDCLFFVEKPGPCDSIARPLSKNVGCEEEASLPTTIFQGLC